MKQLISLSREFHLPSQQTDSRGIRRFNFRAVASTFAPLLLVIFGGIGVAQGQQPDPLTITKDGNVGIGTTAPANKLSVAGSADVSGNVGIGVASPSEKLHVNGTIRVDDAPLKFFGGGNLKAFVGAGRNNDFSLVAKDNEKWLRLGSNKGGIGLWANGNAESGDTPQFLLTADGNVGIGTTNPQFGKLQVAGGATTALRLDANSGVAAMSIGGTGELLVDAVGVTGGRLSVKDNGNVGIGTNNPTRAKLEISGGVNQTVRQYGFLNLGNPTGKFDVPGPDAVTVPYSIWADRRVAAEEFNAFSDERLKNIQGRSDSATDLRTLLGIEIIDYRNKDVIAKGNGTYKKVTGQQVAKVFPQAVSKPPKWCLTFTRRHRFRMAGWRWRPI